MGHATLTSTSVSTSCRAHQRGVKGNSTPIGAQGSPTRRPHAGSAVFDMNNRIRTQLGCFLSQSLIDHVARIGPVEHCKRELNFRHDTTQNFEWPVRGPLDQLDFSHGSRCSSCSRSLRWDVRLSGSTRSQRRQQCDCNRGAKEPPRDIVQDCIHRSSYSLCPWNRQTWAIRGCLALTVAAKLLALAATPAPSTRELRRPAQSVPKDHAIDFLASRATSIKSVLTRGR